MTSDPILALESLGYTDREAAFVYLVAVHSGYFLRRQFDYFIDRQKGAIAHNFLDKARRLGHVRAIDLPQGRKVYHLFAKPIYRLLGDAESQNRRIKLDASIRVRLIALDYILENSDDHYLELSPARLQYFGEVRGIPREIFTDARGSLIAFLDSFPISLADRAAPLTTRARFLFVDEGLFTTTRFVRFLSLLEPLLRMVGNFELVYAASSRHNFDAAHEAFERRFAELSPAQAALSQDWLRPAARGKTHKFPPLQAQFTTVLFSHHYPMIWRHERLGSRAGSPVGAMELEASL
jgi:hypothetical protein